MQIAMQQVSDMTGNAVITVSSVYSDAGSDQNLCSVTNATLAGNTPVTGEGTWSMISGPNTPVITSPNSPSSTITGMTGGTYVFKWLVTDGTCTSISDVTIRQPASVLSAAINTQTNVICKGGNTGTVTVSVTGGTAPYSYLWNTSPMQTGMTAINLSAGNYTVIVTDNFECTAIASVTITEPAAGISASINSHTNVLCYGNNSGSATVAVSNGTEPYIYLSNSSRHRQG